MNRSLSTLIILALLSLSPQIFAVQFECVLGQDQRFIKIDLPGELHLCEVSVTGRDNKRSVKWYANQDTSFCSEKIQELKNKYERQWGFSCQSWPDTDGIDKLSSRHRVILDTELKRLITKGQNALPAFKVKSVKAASRRADAFSTTLALQFFTTELETGKQSDQISIIVDSNNSWQTLTTIDSIAEFITPDENYVVDAALINAITDVGALEILTVLAPKSGSYVKANEDSEQALPSAKTYCYGRQILLPQGTDVLVPRTPHRFVCDESGS